jgi:ABC-type ATPase with predicted acetyltransferase domain
MSEYILITDGKNKRWTLARRQAGHLDVYTETAKFFDPNTAARVMRVLNEGSRRVPIRVAAE